MDTGNEQTMPTQSHDNNGSAPTPFNESNSHINNY